MPSTVIKSFTYNAGQQILTIVFQTGSVYNYLNVPEMKYEEMKQAFSKGTYYNEYIKPFHSFEKVQ